MNLERTKNLDDKIIKIVIKVVFKQKKNGWEMNNLGSKERS